MFHLNDFLKDCDIAFRNKTKCIVGPSHQVCFSLNALISYLSNFRQETNFQMSSWVHCFMALIEILKGTDSENSACIFHGGPGTKGWTYYMAHDQTGPNVSQTDMLYLKTFHVGLGGQTVGPSSSSSAVSFKDFGIKLVNDLGLSLHLISLARNCGLNNLRDNSLNKSHQLVEYEELKSFLKSIKILPYKPLI